MEFTYVSGLFLAFAFGLFRLIFNVSMLHTMRSRNLRKVGKHWNMFSGTYEDEEMSGLAIAWFALVNIALGPIFSWLNVFWNAYTIAVVVAIGPKLPEKLLEIRFILSTAELPKERVQDLFSQMGYFALNYKVVPGYETENKHDLSA